MKIIAWFRIDYSDLSLMLDGVGVRPYLSAALL